MLLFCSYNEYISLQIKEIYKMNILEEIIPILVLKWYFKLGILHPYWLWILKFVLVFLLEGRDLLHVQSFIIKKSLLRRLNSIKGDISKRTIWNPSLTKHFLQKIRYIAYVCYHNTWRSIWYLCGNR